MRELDRSMVDFTFLICVILLLPDNIYYRPHEHPDSKALVNGFLSLNTN